MFTDVYLDCYSLLCFPVYKSYLLCRRAVEESLTTKLYSATHQIKNILKYVTTLGDAHLFSFTINDWTRLIVTIVLAFRLSFPLPSVSHNYLWARSHLQLDYFLSTFSSGTNLLNASNDIITASRAVFGVVLTKYNSKLYSASSATDASTSTSRSFGCPVMDE